MTTTFLVHADLDRKWCFELSRFWTIDNTIDGLGGPCLNKQPDGSCSAINLPNCVDRNVYCSPLSAPASSAPTILSQPTPGAQLSIFHLPPIILAWLFCNPSWDPNPFPCTSIQSDYSCTPASGSNPQPTDLHRLSFN